MSCWEPPLIEQVKMARKHFHQHSEPPADRHTNDLAWSDWKPVSVIMEELLRTRKGESRESFEGFLSSSSCRSSLETLCRTREPDFEHLILL